MSVISYSYNLGDFVKDFYELSMILISYELELNPGIKSNPTRSKKVFKLRVLDRPQVAYFAVSLLYLAFEYLTWLLTLDGVH